MGRLPKTEPSFKGLHHFIAHPEAWSGCGGYLSGLLNQGLARKALRGKHRLRAHSMGLLRWGTEFLPNYFQREASQMHQWLGEQLLDLHMRRGTKLNVLGPRGGAKSTIGTLCYVLRAALEGWERYIWIISDTAAQAENHLRGVKTELESNQLLAQAYPDSHGPGERWRVDSIKLPNGVSIECFGTGQSVRGFKDGDARPSLIVCDDIENDSHIESSRQRDLSRTWFQTALINAGNQDTNFINLATALHRDALAMQLRRTPGWDSHVFSAIVRWPERMELWETWERIYADQGSESPQRRAWNFYQQHKGAMDAGAEVLWPAWETLYTLMKMRVERGHAAFEREKQNSPTDPTRCEWPAEYFADHIWFTEWPTNLRFKVMALDPSKGRDGRQGDYSAFVVLGVDKQGVVFVAADLARRPTPQIVLDGVRLCREHRAEAFGVEANQFQELLADEFEAEFARQGIHWCAPNKIHNTVAKQMRIRRIGPWLSSRRMRFLQGDASTELLVDQLRDFPLGSHDDGPDALEMALRLAEELCFGPVGDDGLGNRLVGGE